MQVVALQASLSESASVHRLEVPTLPRLQHSAKLLALLSSLREVHARNHRKHKRIGEQLLSLEEGHQHSVGHNPIRLQISVHKSPTIELG